jgi:hypothetical protein
LPSGWRVMRTSTLLAGSRSSRSRMPDAFSTFLGLPTQL